MSKCINDRVGKMLYAYELGMLDDRNVEELEIHLLECSYCNKEALQLERAAQLIGNDIDLRELITDLAETSDDFVDYNNIDTKSGKLKSGYKSFKMIWQTYVPSFVAVAAILFILLVKPWHIEIHPNLQAIAAQNSLAIMYFETLADDGGSSKLGEIATNLLITDLSESQYMKVISVQRLQDALKHLGVEESRVIGDDVALQVAAETGAIWILKGTILQIEPHLIITTQLINTATGQIESAKQIKGNNNEDIFSLVDRLAVRIRDDLSLPEAAMGEPDRRIADITTHSSEAYRYYLEGVENASKFYTAEAIESFRKAVEIDSTFAMAYYYLGGLLRAHQRGEALEKAIKFSEHVSRKDKYYIRCQKAANENNYVQAIVELEELVKQFPEEKRAYLLLGRYSSYLNKYGYAILYLNKAIEIDPWYKDAYNELAYRYNDIDDFEESIWAINKYIELAPDEPNPYDSRGDIYLRYGKTKEAINSFEMALEKKSDFNHSLWALSRIYYTYGKYEQAKRYNEILSNSSDMLYRIDGRLGPVYKMLYQGKFNQALAILDDYIKADQENLTDLDDNVVIAYEHILKSKIFSELNDNISAIEEYNLYVEIYKKARPTLIPRYHRNYIQLLAKAGKFEEASKAAEDYKIRLEELNNPPTNYLYCVGIIAFERKDFKNAIEYLNIAANNNLFDAHYYLGLTYLELGDYETVIKIFGNIQYGINRQRIFEPLMETKTHYYLGKAYEESHWLKKAIKEYTIFIKMWGDADSNITLVEEVKEKLIELKNKQDLTSNLQ